MTHSINSDVAIVGGGPCGLMLAIELGCRGVRCVLLEEDANPPDYPKANATSARTMEHYRRRGFSDRVRALGLPPDHPQDVVYCTRLTGHELGRFRIPSAAQAAAGTFHGDFDEASWPTPELPHRAQQILIEPVLREEVGRYASVDARYGWRVEALQDVGDEVRVTAKGVATGEPLEVRARYLVGCDGARSLVRKTLGIALRGRDKEVREFFGGMMAGIHLHAPALTRLLETRRGWQYWVANPQRRGVVVALGDDRFAAGVQLRPDQSADQLDVQAVLDELTGERFAYLCLGVSGWLAGYALVADRYRLGRCLLAGDAAHLFTPAAGMGYNTGVDDVVNLGWKLAAVLQGWGGDALLDSYEAERKPVGARNTDYARAMADSMGALTPPADLESDGPAGEEARSRYGERCLAHMRREFNIPGLQLGVRYESAVVLPDGAVPPTDDPIRYQAGGHPGARAPHVAMEGGSLLDRFGREFTLLCDSTAAQDWVEAALALGIDLAIVPWPDAAPRDLYGASMVLVRPDHHIAWRGDQSVDALDILAAATGRRLGGMA